MGGDSTASNGFTVQLQRRPKVFRKGELLFGYTSSFRMGQLLEFKLDVPSHHPDMPDFTWMVTELVEAIRTTFRSGGYTTVENQAESGGEFLIGYRGHLYQLYSDFQVGERLEDFAAVGSGEYHAMAILYALKDAPLTPQDRIHRALEGAAHFVVTVNPPFTVIDSG